MENLNKKALNYCLFLLARHSYSSKQIRDKLKSKKYPPRIIEETERKLIEWKYLDDAVFAANFSSDRLRFKRKSVANIVRELQWKGIERDLALQTTKKTLRRLGLDEESLAKSCLEKKINVYRNLEPKKGLTRARNYLLRQGFSYEITGKITGLFWSQK